jgi:myo-inositol-1(or 4)-monophosphatase
VRELDFARRLVVRAGDFIKSRRSGRRSITFKDAHRSNLVTDMDRASEDLIVSAIRKEYPDHSIVAEEGGESGNSPFRWYIDPIDGTTNFAHGVPIFCASVALEVAGEAQVAAVYDPTRRELFTAERGCGAQLNGRPIHVSAAERLVDAVLVTGFPYDVHDRVDEIVGLFGAFVGRARAVRRLGSAAIDLCYVAAGRLDGFWESDLKPWDIAGGSLIVSEAGGRVTAMDGSPFTSRTREVLATNHRLHDQMLDVVASFRSQRAAR